ncbi:hypothetical protein ASD56_06020 [Microbacterium sp. Root166]|uniref:hypothetical protein n=1 Tax=Microbacterium sp. Root166 TaxID=1736478 RepID=UPI0006F571F0|nr:hypothetical protein [Microbacterium sp. Root166]KQZ85835.1 hypothetical protein ASD56_06020 [Microbacterium sp. Root166]
MTLHALRADALSSTTDGFALRLSLPWIRSLPVASLSGPVVRIDGAPSGPLLVQIGDRSIPSEALVHEREWWFVQDRVVLRGRRPVAPGAHEVTVVFELVVPYLQSGPDGPLRLPFTASRTLVTDAPTAVATVSRDVA